MSIETERAKAADMMEEFSKMMGEVLTTALSQVGGKEAELLAAALPAQLAGLSEVGEQLVALRRAGRPA